MNRKWVGLCAMFAAIAGFAIGVGVNPSTQDFDSVLLGLFTLGGIVVAIVVDP